MIPLKPPICYKCKHFKIREYYNEAAGEEGWYCKAFPKKIPEEIATGNHDHKEPFPGDKGVLFERNPYYQTVKEGE